MAEQLQDTPSAPPPVVVLNYQSVADHAHPLPPRPWWVWAVVGVYGLLLAGLASLPFMLAVSPSRSDHEAFVAASITAAVVLACGLVLMLVPIGVTRRRRAPRCTIGWSIAASGLLAGGLVFGGTMAMVELLGNAGTVNKACGPAIIAAASVWLIWGIVFSFVVQARGAADVGMKLHHWLIAGSILELLIAVPAHIVVRRRDECCAGMATGFGICAGIVVMMVAFGPSVVILYWRRARSIAIPKRVKAGSLDAGDKY